MPTTVQCEECSRSFDVKPARASTAKFCSVACRARWRSKHWIGENHPRWQGGEREKPCHHCGKVMRQGKETIAYFRERKFCSRECAKYGQRRLSGKDHPLYKPDSRRANRRGKHGAWARAVISRDKETCQRCGATHTELHAHHILSFADNPSQRWDLDNGTTLCAPCHWAVHSASDANGVNSGNILPGKAGDNPEPSFGRKPVEGVTTRGRAYRRWAGKCDWCGSFISKRWSDVQGKRHLFCSRKCATTHTANTREWHRARNPKKPPRQ